MKISVFIENGRIEELRHLAKRNIRAASTVTLFPHDLLALIELIDALKAKARKP